LHKNLDRLNDFDVNTFIISGDSPEQQKELYNALVQEYGKSLPFISDPELKMTELFDMRNGEVPFRGYGLLDQKGNVVFHTANDYWGEELDKTIEEIKEGYNGISS